MPENEAGRNQKNSEEPEVADWTLMFDQVSRVTNCLEGADSEIRSVCDAAEASEEPGQVRDVHEESANCQPDQNRNQTSKDRAAPGDG